MGRKVLMEILIPSEGRVGIIELDIEPRPAPLPTRWNGDRLEVTEDGVTEVWKRTDDGFRRIR